MEDQKRKNEEEYRKICAAACSVQTGWNFSTEIGYGEARILPDSNFNKCFTRCLKAIDPTYSCDGILIPFKKDPQK